MESFTGGEDYDAKQAVERHDVQSYCDSPMSHETCMGGGGGEGTWDANEVFRQGRPAVSSNISHPYLGRGWENSVPRRAWESIRPMSSRSQVRSSKGGWRGSTCPPGLAQRLARRGENCNFPCEMAPQYKCHYYQRQQGCASIS